MKENKLYCCFSIPLKQFLTSKKVRYELVALNPNTKNKMWIYIKNEQLDNFLIEWSNGSR